MPVKSIFDSSSGDEIINRIQLLTEQNKTHWGKMTVTQMLRHCAMCEAYYYGKVPIARSWIGRIVGRAALKKILKEGSLGKNAPTATPFKVGAMNLDFAVEKENWKRLIERYRFFERETFKHWFFGKMTKAQLGQFIYLHCDHHLQQFGV